MFICSRGPSRGRNRGRSRGRGRNQGRNQKAIHWGNLKSKTRETIGKRSTVLYSTNFKSKQGP